jgi:hypothetical protein
MSSLTWGGKEGWMDEGMKVNRDEGRIEGEVSYLRLS